MRGGALFFCVRLISSSIEAIFSMMSDMAKPCLGFTRLNAHYGRACHVALRERE